ncbi:hypothetical protein AXX17_AT2G07100 [Arabidopsis thaliana]|uniref:Uncharacterized protein n=1 Tax=Arabidopsis thaliana TaxID=3702 RepID=A0A178VVM3_ARATH|nr:hypothetical protein AXX17_AT2G07100 [Arabidopsis thaliana]
MISARLVMPRFAAMFLKECQGNNACIKGNRRRISFDSNEAQLNYYEAQFSKSKPSNI